MVAEAIEEPQERANLMKERRRQATQQVLPLSVWSCILSEHDLGRLDALLPGQAPMFSGRRVGVPRSRSTSSTATPTASWTWSGCSEAPAVSLSSFPRRPPRRRGHRRQVRLRAQEGRRSRARPARHPQDQAPTQGRLSRLVLCGADTPGSTTAYRQGVVSCRYAAGKRPSS